MTPLYFPAASRRRAEPTMSLYLFDRELPASERIIDLDSYEWTDPADAAIPDAHIIAATRR